MNTFPDNSRSGHAKIDGPMLTAWVLGELDEHDAAHVAKAVEADPELAREAAAILAAAEAVTEALETEPVSLTPQQRAALSAQARGEHTAPFRLPATVTVLGAIAAVVVVGLGALLMFGPRLSGGSPRQAGEQGMIAARPAIQEAEPTETKYRRPSASTAVDSGPSALGGDLRAVAPPSGSRSRGRAETRGGAGGMEEYSLDREGYSDTRDNLFHQSGVEPLSTFSIDVDTASYANTRRYLLSQGSWPPASAVRIEELVNYFNYDYPDTPDTDAPFSTSIDAGPCPWALDHRLVRIGLKGRAVTGVDRESVNLVFLLDVSGSMNRGLKLPLLKRAMKLLVDNLGAEDRVAIVVYAGSSGMVLPPTYSDAEGRTRIMAALERLKAGGSTNGAGGIQQAYAVAQETFIEGGVNRVILCTDGDFNVGTSSDGELRRLIEEKRASGVSLSVLGFGRGNLQDHKMETLADSGNGNYSYIDSISEARKVLVEEMGSTLQTIAKDVKIQVEFNPARVEAYRLIGYENRVLAAEDFNDDTVDAGEIGAGHTVTALYEIVPVGADSPAGDVDPLKYQVVDTPGTSEDLLTVKLRWKEPGGDVSSKIEFPFVDPGTDVVSEDFNFAAGVAAFGMILRDSPDKGQATLAMVRELTADGDPASITRRQAAAQSLGRLLEAAKAGDTDTAESAARWLLERELDDQDWAAIIGTDEGTVDIIHLPSAGASATRVASVISRVAGDLRAGTIPSPAGYRAEFRRMVDQADRTRGE